MQKNDILFFISKKLSEQINLQYSGIFFIYTALRKKRVNLKNNRFFVDKAGVFDYNGLTNKPSAFKEAWSL